MTRGDFLLVAALLLPLSAAANPPGIAFVQAPEQAMGVAMGATPAEGFANATQVCVDGGALAEDCIPTNWCQPAGWSIDLFMQHVEGVHWHHVACGLPSREQAEAVAEVMCDTQANPWIMECMLVQIRDPEGNPLDPDP